MSENIEIQSVFFEKKEAHWEIVRGTKMRVVTMQGNNPAYYCDTLEKAAEKMSEMVKRTIMAMPKNGARIITLDCRWS